MKILSNSHAALPACKKLDPLRPSPPPPRPPTGISRDVVFGQMQECYSFWL